MDTPADIIRRQIAELEECKKQYVMPKDLIDLCKAISEMAKELRVVEKPAESPKQEAPDGNVS